MDSEEEKEYQEKEKELAENFENNLKSLFADSVEQWSLLNRIIVYVIFTIFIFIGGIFSIAKKIILIRFSKIPIDFKTMGFMDGVLKKFFRI
jgi:hypothetical protein